MRKFYKDDKRSLILYFHCLYFLSKKKMKTVNQVIERSQKSNK